MSLSFPKMPSALLATIVHAQLPNLSHLHRRRYRSIAGTPLYQRRGWEHDHHWGKVGSEYSKMSKMMMPIWGISGLTDSWLLPPPPPPLDSLSFYSLLPLPHLGNAYKINAWFKQAKHSDPLNTVNFLIKTRIYKRTQLPIWLDPDIMTKWVYHWYIA